MAETMAGAAWPYLLVLLVGFLPTEVWRILAVILVRGIDEGSEFFVWVRSVATTLLAGVVAKLLIFPSGALAHVPFLGRVGAILAGLAGFLVLRRSIIAGVLLGEAVLVTVAWWWGA